MTAKDLIKHYDSKKAERGLQDTLWQEIAEYIFPNRATITTEKSLGSKLTLNLVDSTGYDALVTLSLWLSASLTSMAMDWFNLRIGDSSEEIVDQAGQSWLDSQKKKQFAALRASNFSAQMDACYIDWAGFGQGLIYADESTVKREGFNGFHFECIPPGTYVLEQDSEGKPCYVGREFKMTASAAVGKWGDKAGEKVIKAAEKQATEKFLFLHVVHPAEWAGARKKSTHPFLSYYLNYEDRKIITQGGYHELPYAAFPWMQVSGEAYGRGCGHIALPDCRTLNKAEEMTLKAWAKAIDPPVEIWDQGIIGSINLVPGGKSIVSAKETIRAIESGSRLDLNSIEREQKRAQIRRIFHNDKIMILPPVEDARGDMTKYEVALRYELAQKLLGSPFNNLINLGLDKIIERSFGLMYRAGALDPPPPSILKASQSDQSINIQYESPLARAQRLEKVDSMQKLFAFTAPLEENHPEIGDNIDYDQAIREAGSILGLPAKVVRGKDEVQKFRQQKAAAVQSQNTMDQLQQGAEIAGKALPALKDADPQMLQRLAEAAGRSGIA